MCDYSVKREDVVRRLRLLTQELESGEIDSLVCLVMYQDGVTRELIWVGDRQLEMLGLMNLSVNTFTNSFDREEHDSDLQGC